MILGLTKRLVVIDAETASPVDLKKRGAAVYFDNRDTRTLMIGHEAGGDPVWELRKSAQSPQELAELAVLPPEECMFAAFNAGFDHRALALAGIETPIEKWLDIALLAYALSFAGGLDDVLKQAGLKVQKNTDGSRLIQKFSVQQTPWYRAPEDWQKFVGYCANDVAVERKLLDFCLRWLDQPHMHAQMRDLQRQWLMDWRTNERGLPVDVEGLQGALQVKDDEVQRLTGWMRERTGLDNPNSVSQLQAWCAANGAALPNLQAATVRDYLAGNLMPPVQHVADVLTARLQMGKASVKKLDAFERRRTGDRLRGSYITLGASRTGRQASRGANLANLERPKIKDADLAAELLREGDAEQVRWHYGSDVMTVLGSSVRAMLKAPPGKSFCVYDFKSIESVGAAWLAGCDSILDIFFQGRDTYKTFASRFFGVPYDEVTDWQRLFSKPCFLGFGFGAGPKALQNYAHKAFNLEISDEDARLAIDLARTDYPEIKELWYDYLNTAKLAVMRPGTTQWTHSNGFKNRRCAYYYDGTFLQCRIPSGTTIYYYKPGIEAHQPDPENNPDWVTQSLYYYGRLQDEGGKWTKIHTHGGSLLENNDQKLCRDVLYGALERIDLDPDIEVVGSTYDEAITLIDWGDEAAAERMQQLMKTPSPWMDDRFFLDCDGYHNVKRYRK